MSISILNRSSNGSRPWVPSRPLGDVDVDVTPVMNMFMILIPFLVSMAVFSNLAVQSFRLPAGESAGQAQSADDLPWTVAVTSTRIAVARGEWILGSCDRTDDGHDFAALATILRDAQATRPGLDRVVVAVDDGIVCADVVHTLDRCREAGFTEVGLAEGTGLDGQIVVSSNSE
jgi:biopolymer transport protein ExbD